MFVLRSVYPVAALCVMLLAQISFSASCSKPVISYPAPLTSLEPAPSEAVALNLWKEFKADEGAALAKYEGKTLHFARVSVDKMTFLGEGGDVLLFVQEGIDPNIEQVKFITHTAYDIINVRDNYIVEIVGKVQGMQFGYLVVNVDWLKVIDPPGGDTNPPAEY